LQDATWVGYRLSELLPLSSIEKQHLLELPDPLDRLQNLLEILPRFQL
jgi:Lon protease-like protein